MAISGKCPKCDQFMNHVNLEYIDVNVALKSQWKGVSYLCPYCSCILSVGIDPIAIKADIVGEISRKLQAR